MRADTEGFPIKDNGLIELLDYLEPIVPSGESFRKIAQRD